MVTVIGTFRPTATECWPRGFRMIPGEGTVGVWRKAVQFCVEAPQLRLRQVHRGCVQRCVHAARSQK